MAMELKDTLANERRIPQACPLGINFFFSLDYARYYDKIG